MIPKPRSLAANALWNTSATVWSMVAVFFMAPFLIHWIGEEEYGLFLLLASISGVLGVADLGLGEATLRYVAHYGGKQDLQGVNRVFQATVAVYAVLATLAALALFVGARAIVEWLGMSGTDESSVLLLKITAFSFWVRFLAGPFFAIPQALLRYDLSSGLTVIQSVRQGLRTSYLPFSARATARIALPQKIVHALVDDRLGGPSVRNCW